MKNHPLLYLMVTAGLGFFAAACASSSGVTATETPAPTGASSGMDEAEYEIVTLLPFDGIPAIDDPEFLSIAQADEEYAPDEMVIGVEFNGQARAYSVPHLSSHEIVNDTVGGVKITVTW